MAEDMSISDFVTASYRKSLEQAQLQVDKLHAQERRATCGVFRGQRYRHYKSGSVCEVTSVAVEQTSLQVVVSYVYLDTYNEWCHTLDDFLLSSQDTTGVEKRFQLCQ